MTTDSNGREIRPGDGVEHDGRTSVVVGFRGEFVRVMNADETVNSWFPKRLTVVTRSGEPIEQISPLVICAKTGGVIERGRRVNSKVVDPRSNPGTVLHVYSHPTHGALVMVQWDNGNTSEWFARELTLLPPEPETEERTYTVVQKRGSDLTPALKAMVDVVEVRG